MYKGFLSPVDEGSIEGLYLELGLVKVTLLRHDWPLDPALSLLLTSDLILLLFKLIDLTAVNVIGVNPLERSDVILAIAHSTLAVSDDRVYPVQDPGHAGVDRGKTAVNVSAVLLKPAKIFENF